LKTFQTVKPFLLHECW